MNDGERGGGYPYCGYKLSAFESDGCDMDFVTEAYGKYSKEFVTKAYGKNNKDFATEDHSNYEPRASVRTYVQKE